MPTDYRTVRRRLDRELTYLEDCYLALRDLKSDGALLLYDDAVESIAAAMQRLQDTTHWLDLQSGLWSE